MNYYRKFIKGFSLIALPLFHLTRKGVTYEWSGLCESAFNRLREALLSAPCLHAPDFKLPFLLQTDASGEGIGAVLTQMVNGEEHPIAFVSRQLSKAEKNYSATEWECLAVVWAVTQFVEILTLFTCITQIPACNREVNKTSRGASRPAG